MRLIRRTYAVILLFAMSMSLIPQRVDTSLAKTKTVTVNVGKKKTIPLYGGNRAKKIKWSVKDKKVISIVKKNRKKIVIKGKKAGTTKLTMKAYMQGRTVKITIKVKVVKAASKKTNKGNSNKTKPKASPDTNAPKPGDLEYITEDGKITVIESETKKVDITELNETPYTSELKSDYANEYPTAKDKIYFDGGGVKFVSNASSYSSGVCYYANSCRDVSKLIKLADNGNIIGYPDCVLDVSAYDYMRMKVKTKGELVLKIYGGTINYNIIDHVFFPGKYFKETNESRWIGPAGGYLKDDIKKYGMVISDSKYEERTIFIKLANLQAEVDWSNIGAVAVSSMDDGTEVTIYDISFVKVRK